MPRLEIRTPTGESTRELAPGRRFVLGRAEDADLAVPDDPKLSRRHAELWLEGDALVVKRLPGASNPIHHDGRPADQFVLQSGGHFTIGGSRFAFVTEAPQAYTMSAAQLYAGDRLKLTDLLELPELLRGLHGAALHERLARMLREAAGARWACVAAQDGTLLGEAGADPSAPRALSRTLLARAIADCPRPTLYQWGAGQSDATAIAGVDWAVCAAAKLPEGALVLYAAGSGPLDGAGAVETGRFAGLVADIVGRTLSNDRLVEWQGRLRRFFAGAVADKVLASPDLSALKPRLAQSTVLFFDIRGYSLRTERSTAKILGYTDDLRRAMTAVTEAVLAEHGVVLQYMGDGMLACWNVPFDERDHVDRAVRCALRMAGELAKATGWRCGVGLQTGEVVAGALGSDQVFSYGVLGSVVNQASRVEGMTKLLGVTILATKDVVSQLSGGVAASRRLGRFLPAGMETPLELYELAAPEVAPPPPAFGEGLAAFEAGRFDEAIAKLSLLPATDGPVRFLLSQCIEHKRSAPPSWNGVVRLDHK